MTSRRRWTCALIALVLLGSSCGGGSEEDGSSSPLLDHPLPSAVSVPQEPDGGSFADPTFEALPGATAEFGHLGGATYQIEMPDGTNLDVDDLSALDRTFELAPRPGTPAAADAPGADERAVVTGRALVDGAAVDARWVGAVVLDHGLVTPCQYTLPPVDRGTVCGVASVRSAGYFILSVVGPDSLPGCESGGRITFLVEGAPTIETSSNTPAESRQLDLTLPT